MGHSSTSDWRTFLGFCGVCLAVTTLIGWRLLSLHAVPPGTGLTKGAYDQPSEGDGQPARVDDSSVAEIFPPKPEQIESAVEPASETVPAALIARSDFTAVSDLTVAESVVSSKVGSETVPVNPSATKPHLKDETSELALGKRLFLHEWQPHDKLAGGDGLGPVFNGRSCAECHSLGGLGGAGTNEHSVREFEILPSIAGADVRTGVIHTFATTTGDFEDLESLDRQFRPGTVVAGVAQPHSRVLTKKRDIEATRLVWINSPALWGLGSIDRVTSDQLDLATRFTTGRNQSGRFQDRTQGRFRVHPDGRIGKFGWKGQFASLKEFVAGACATELGLSNEDARQQIPREFRPDPKAPHDLNSIQLAAMVKFVADLPEPRQVMPDDQTRRALVTKGEDLITRIGCTDCHTRNIADVKNVYSDYRLHSVEDTLNPQDAYYIQDFKLEIEPPGHYARLDEWRTPALWGVADTAPYWHDGSAKTLEAAILRHARDAQPALDAYRQLVREDQQCVLAFLNTLHGPTRQPLPGQKVAMSDTIR